MDEYPITDKDGYEWIGVRPNFTEEIKKLNDKRNISSGIHVSSRPR